MDTRKAISDMPNQNLQSKGQEIGKPKRSPNEGIFMSVTKKSEKIVTAIYMLTDLIPEKDPMRHKLRDTSLQMLTKSYKRHAKSKFTI
jgi:hypothetical protein